MVPTVHRSGLLKQSNKPHKTGGHRSKGAVDNASKGRVGLKTISRQSTKLQSSRRERRHQCKQIRDRKKFSILEAKRNIGGQNSPPLLTAVVPLFDACDVEFRTMLEEVDNVAVTTSSCGLTHLAFPRFRKRFAFVFPDRKNPCGILDAIKVCDALILLVSPDQVESLDPVRRQCMSAIFSQGLAFAPTFVIARESECLNLKKKIDLKKLLLKQLQKICPGTEKVFTLEKGKIQQEMVLLLRHLSDQKRKKSSMKSYRPHLIAENVEFLGEDAVGTMKVSGYVRCNSPDYRLSVNRLIHIPGWGDFQLQQIDSLVDQHPLVGDKKAKAVDDEFLQVLAVADEQRLETLVCENEPDPMDGEQTWPTEEELRAAETESGAKKSIKVPKGTSSYQAAWIADVDDDDVEEQQDSDDDDDDGMEHDGQFDAVSQQSSEDEEVDEDEYETMTVTDGGNEDSNYDEKYVIAAEEKEALEKVKAAKMDAMFPDEVDTPADQQAKVRFQKYRGLSSFRSSPWDRKENLPIDYSRIFQFQNFLCSRKRVFSELSNVEGIEVGAYVALHVKQVSRHVYNNWKRTGSPLVLFSMLPHEQKMSVLNFVVKRHPGAATTGVVESKERLVFHVGYRRFSACPIFSQHTNGDKHKYVRFWQPEDVVVMTVFAPIMFPPANVTVYREMSSGRHQLIGGGSLLSVDPNRMVIKRAVLSGYPFKVHRRSSVIRFMFYNRQDIEWFKPVELRTKRGRRGHIKEPLGTHGHMKVVFDGPITQQDTVMMNLYKRVFPKWNYDPFAAEFRPNDEDGEKLCFIAKDVLQLNKKETSTAME